jgi:hypothetical protein
LAKLERAGLLWIGAAFYPTPGDFMREAAALGVSRRIPAIPRGFRLGVDWVLMAHPAALERAPRTEEEREELAELNKARAKDELPLLTGVTRGGVVTMFQPVRFEKIVTDTEAKDEAAMAALAEKGITPVAVPDNDPDHMDPRAAKRLQGALELAPDRGPLARTQAEVDAFEEADIDARMAEAAAAQEVDRG